MSFLNPIWLLALPLVLLPIVIHLWNQRRHKIIQWGAMQFLITAKRMSRGMARLRHWLIMAARMLAVAGILLLITRPLASGWLGVLSGGKPESVLILLDRSASMQQQSSLAGQSKLQTGIDKIRAALETLGSTSQIYLIDPFSSGQTAGSARVIPLQSPRDLQDLPEAQPTESSVDLPTMLQTALDFVTTNQTGRTDIWILSDAAENDWQPTSSRWQALQTAFAKLEGIRFHFLNYPEPVDDNLAVSVDRWERRLNGTQPELSLDLSIRRTQRSGNSARNHLAPQEVPLTIEVGGVRSVVKVNLDGDATSLVGHRIPLDQETKSGWGSVELPADSNASDNHYFFAFAEPAPLQTVIVSTNPQVLQSIELAASVPWQRDLTATVTNVPPERLAEIDWAQTTMLIWHGNFPDGEAAALLERFSASGRSILFLPPEEPNSTTFAGWSWTEWEKPSTTGSKLNFWNNDADLWMRTRDGQSLPLDELIVYQHCRLSGGGRILAKLDNDAPILVRSVNAGGAIYALTTLPTGTYSSLDRDGIALYVLVQRSLAKAAESQGTARSLDAGTQAARTVADRTVLSSNAIGSGSAPMLNALKPFRAGVYGSGDEFVALNRPALEEQFAPLGDELVRELFANLDLRIIKDQLTSDRSLASEIWKMFVVLAVVALLVEAVLSLPEKSPQPSGTVAALPAGRVAA